MQYLKIITVSAFITAVSLFGAYNYLPFPVDKLGEQMLGTSVTEISSTDKMKDFPTTYNANLAAINAGKMEISTTTLPLITTLSGLTTAGSLATVGTIGTGAWAADVIPIAYGGTGSSTLTAYTVLLGNGTSAMDGVVSLGTSDQVLTSNGAGAKPTWQSTAVDETAAYTWTGNHIWNTGTTVFNGFSTMADVVFASTTAPTPTADQHVANKGYVDASDTTDYYFSNDTFASCNSSSYYTTDTFTHGLGVAPSHIKVTAFGVVTASNGLIANSVGIYDGTNYKTVYTDSVNDVAATDTSNVLNLSYSTNMVLIATSSITSTTIDINAFCNGYSDANQTAHYLIEAWRY